MRGLGRVSTGLTSVQQYFFQAKLACNTVSIVWRNLWPRRA